MIPVDVVQVDGTQGLILVWLVLGFSLLIWLWWPRKKGVNRL